MCLVLLAWHAHRDYPLIVAANRDEFFDRPTGQAAFWEDNPGVLGGRDLARGGTWLGITRSGRFAALTNYREPSLKLRDALSRGAVVARFLTDEESPARFRDFLDTEGHKYNGFNILFSDGRTMGYYSNVDGGGRVLAPGIYGLSNHLLDTPWPKVVRAKNAVSSAIDALPDVEPLFTLLRDDRIAHDEELPDTGVSLDWERLLSAAFVRSPSYGTRSSTVLFVTAGGLTRFVERTFLHDGAPGGDAAFTFYTV